MATVDMFGYRMAGLAAAAMLLVVCGGKVGSENGSSEGTGERDGVPEAEFLSLRKQEVCRAMSLCCADEGRQLDESECDATIQLMIDQEVAQAGTVLYDPVLARACLTRLANVSTCQPNEALNATCERVYHGNKRVGESCEDRAECAPVEGGTVECDANWVCHLFKWGVEGEACSESWEWRGSGPDSPVSVQWADDWKSGVPNDGVPDHTTVVCWRNEGLFCSPEGCKRLVEPNRPCVPTDDCVAGYYCDGRTCVPKKAAGASCTTGFPLECLGVCNPNGNVCEGDSTSTAPPDVEQSDIRTWTDMLCVR